MKKKDENQNGSEELKARFRMTVVFREISQGGKMVWGRSYFAGKRQKAGVGDNAFECHIADIPCTGEVDPEKFVLAMTPTTLGGDHSAFLDLKGEITDFEKGMNELAYVTLTRFVLDKLPEPIEE